MSFDRMLLWLSAKGRGRWSQFRVAVENLMVQENEIEADVEDDSTPDNESDLPVYQQVRFALQRLGHVEFYTAGSENGWRVVPPTVAIRDAVAAKGLLCGARSPALLERLAAARDLTVESTPIAGMPERIVVRGASHKSLVARMCELGFLIQKEAPASLLSGLPTVRDRSGWYASNMPETPGWLVHRFSIYPEPQWTELRQADALKAPRGLFKFVMAHQRFYYLRWRGCTYSVPVQVGKYAVLRRRGALKYDYEQRTLSVPAVLRPPLLIERALVLCSGVLPRLNTSTRRLQYPDVHDNVALLAGQLLHQEVR